MLMRFAGIAYAATLRVKCRAQETRADAGHAARAVEKLGGPICGRESASNYFVLLIARRNAGARPCAIDGVTRARSAGLPGVAIAAIRR
jgi:hypothetical protein